jgi:hypothetical protein
MKKIGLLCLALVLALGTLGVGYAMWYEDLYIYGTVNTGEVYGYWSACYCFDNGNDPNPDGSNKGKDVGSTVCQIDPTDPRILHITVTNGYPCYWNDCEVEFTIGGTVPIIIEDIIITPDNFTLASAYGADDGELWVDVVDGISLQLHPGDSTAQSFKIHVEQCAAQGATYTFTVTNRLVQYNESIYFP